MRQIGFLLSILASTLTGASNFPTDTVRPPAVTLNIVAVDANNHPVRDLRAQDFRITDNGAILTAEFARFLADRSPAYSQPGSHEYSNRPAIRNSHATLVLFDLLNSNLSERGLAWNDIAVSLKKLTANGPVYLYLLTKEAALYPVTGLPSSTGQEQDAWTSGVKQLLDRAMRTVNQLRPQELQVDADLRTQKTLAAFDALATTFGVQPGRKALIWISHGVPTRAYSAPRGFLTDYTPRIREIAANLNRAGISVYPVDQREDPTLKSVRPQDTEAVESKVTLQSIADLTNGVWFPSNVAAIAIERAAADTHAMYRIGYTPAAKSWDGSFHRIQVTTDRPGVQIRAIEGYYADGAEATTEGRLACAALGPYDAQDIGLRAAMTPSQKVAGWAHFQIHVDAKDLALLPGVQSTGEFRVTCIDYVTTWNSGAVQSTPVKMALTESERNNLLRDGMTVVLDRPVNPAAQKVRIVVQDAISGATGSVTIQR